MTELWIRQSVRIETPGNYYIDSHIVDGEIVETRITPQPIAFDQITTAKQVTWFEPNDS